MSPVAGLFIVLLLVAANGFFVATEFALVSSRSTRVDQLAAQGSRAARMVQRAKSNPTRFISGTQLGVTVASLLLGWIGEETFAQLIQPGLDAVSVLLGQSPDEPGQITATAHAISSVLALFGITFFHITLGEQVPKILALQKSESIIVFAVQPVSALAWVFRPFISLLYLFTNLVLRAIGLEYHGEEHAVHSPEELQLLVTQAARAGLMTAPERELVQRAFAFPDQTAGEVMVPRTEIVWIEQNKSVHQAVALCLRSGFSRIPVIAESVDDVVGVVHLKDLVAAERREDSADGTVGAVMRPATFVPDSKLLTGLLKEMQVSRNHMAVVVDEYGGTAGLLTIEDILEEIVGEIADESDTNERPPIEHLGDGRVRVISRLPVIDLGELFNVDFADSDVETVGGLLAQQLGRVPVPGAEADVAGLRLRAEGGNDRRGRLRITTVIASRAPTRSDINTPPDPVAADPPQEASDTRA